MKKRKGKRKNRPFGSPEPPAINDDYPNIPEHLDGKLEVGRFHLKGTGRVEREHLTFTMKYQSIDDVKILEEQR